MRMDTAANMSGARGDIEDRPQVFMWGSDKFTWNGDEFQWGSSPTPKRSRLDAIEQWMRVARLAAETARAVAGTVAEFLRARHRRTDKKTALA